MITSRLSPIWALLLPFVGRKIPKPKPDSRQLWLMNILPLAIVPSTNSIAPPWFLCDGDDHGMSTDCSHDSIVDGGRSPLKKTREELLKKTRELDLKKMRELTK
jgi:hypothetical protein